MYARKGALLSLCLLAMMTGAGTGTGFCKEALEVLRRKGRLPPL